MFSKIGTLRCFLGIRTRKGLHFRARTVVQKKLENLDGDIFTARQQVVAVKTK